MNDRAPRRTVDMSPAAIDARLRRAGQLLRLCRDLASGQFEPDGDVSRAGAESSAQEPAEPAPESATLVRRS